MSGKRCCIWIAAALVLPQFVTARVVLADGACCRGDGTCVVTSLADCSGMCDRFRGEGTTCAGVLCPVQVPAPCCFNDGSCLVLQPCLCREAGGEPQSPFQSCASVDCPPKGACCRANGVCEVTTADDCVGPCEHYRGDGTDCNGVFCAIQVPAPCCFNDGSCLTLQPCECRALGGDPQSPFVTCESVDCPPKGACCRIDGVCEVTTADDCLGPCERYAGDGTDCTHVLCPIQLSAPCCFADGSCQVMKPCLCLDAGGDPQSPFQTCASVDCRPRGACCHGDGTCEMLPADECAGPCDIYHGDGSDCANTLCIVQAPAPCCLPDGSCYVTNPCLCREAGGDPQSPFLSCASVDCRPKGACCRIDGTCDVTTADDCDGPCEHYVGDGTTCANTHCAIQISAPCCLSDGSCIVVQPCICTSLGGTPQSPFQTCATVNCP